MPLEGWECEGLRVVAEEGVEMEVEEVLTVVERLEVFIEGDWVLLEVEGVLVPVAVEEALAVLEVLAGGGLVVLSAIMSYDDYDANIK